MRRNSRWAMVWVTAVALLVGACGTSGKKATTTTKPTTTASTMTTTTAESTTTTTEPDTSGSTTTTPGSPADKARAATANIVASDFATGWTSSPHEGGPSSTFAKCAPEIDLEDETVAEASSLDFRRLDTSDVRANSLTRILSSDTVAQQVIAKIADPAFVKCTQDLITTSGLKAGTAAGKLSPQQVTGLGDEAAGIDGQLSGVDSATGKQVQLGVSIVAIRTGDLVTVLTGAALGTTRSTDAALFQKLAEAISERQQS